MRTRVQFDLNPMEFEILKNALYNYRGRLIHQKRGIDNNGQDMSYQDVRRAEEDLRTLQKMINEFGHGEEVR